MLGRPEMVVPVFMKVCAGSWLIASVCIERMMQMSSATDADVRKELADLLARLAEFLERDTAGAKHLSFLALELGDRLPFGERLGHRLAVQFGELGFVVERFEVRRAAGHVRKITRLAFGGKCSGLTTPGQ